MSTPITATGRPIFPAGCRAIPTPRASSSEAWISPRHQPYDFLVQGVAWKIGAVSISILRKQFDTTYVAVAFDNNGHAVTLNFILVKGREGWLITDVESPHDSLRMFLAQYRN
jgi:hypothetical protein